MPLIQREMIVGAKERIDSLGKIIRPLDEPALRESIHYLVDKGVRGFVVSLLWSHVNPVHEKRIKEIIREEYKDYTLIRGIFLLRSVKSKLRRREATLSHGPAYG